MSDDSEDHEYLTESIGNAKWAEGDMVVRDRCPISEGQTMLQAAMAQKKSNVVTCLERLAAPEPTSEPEPTDLEGSEV